MINFSQDHNVDRCTVGYTVGWDTTCHIGLTRNPDPDYSCPGFTTSELQHIQDEKYYTPLGKFKQAILWCYGEANHAISRPRSMRFKNKFRNRICNSHNL
jgi:hypothetical protein